MPTGYRRISEIRHDGFSAHTVDNPLAKARELLLRLGGQPMLYRLEDKRQILHTDYISTCSSHVSKDRFIHKEAQ